eukprot:181842-Rhodomonas_salina.3
MRQSTHDVDCKGKPPLFQTHASHNQSEIATVGERGYYHDVFDRVYEAPSWQQTILGEYHTMHGQYLACPRCTTPPNSSPQVPDTAPSAGCIHVGLYQTRCGIGNTVLPQDSRFLASGKRQTYMYMYGTWGRD